MRRRTFVPAIAGLAMSAACALQPRPSPQPAGTATISIVGTMDLHGALSARDGRGGLALLGGYVTNLRAARAADGGGVLLVDAGDMFQGTLESNTSEGAAAVAAYNELGYAAAAIGNHEFDFGPAGEATTPVSPGDDPQGALKARAAEARFPFLGANVLDASTGLPVRWPNVVPSTMVGVAGVEVGIIGVTTASTPSTTIAANLRGIEIGPLAPAIVREATALRGRGADVVVVAAHAGGRCARFDAPTDLQSCDSSGEIMAVARALPPGLVDVIVGGHTHNAMAHEVSGIGIIQAGSSGRAFSRADVTVRRPAGEVVAVRLYEPRQVCEREEPATGRCDAAAAGAASLVPSRYEGSEVAPDAVVAAALEPALRAVETLKRRPLGVVLEAPLPRVRLSESALGNLFADAIRETLRADAALVNGGAIRTDLPAGRITYGQLYEVFPFENRLVALSLTGEQLARILGHNLEPSVPLLEILSISGVRVTAACADGRLDLKLARSSGMPIRGSDRLRVVVTDFLLSGGDGVLEPAGPIDQAVPPDAPFMREETADWLQRRGGRLRADELLPPDQRRWVYPGDRPVRCD